MKHTYDGIEDLLNLTSQAIASTVPTQYSLDLNVIFFPQIGFLISMKRDPHSGQGNYEGSTADAWDRIFSTESRVYYKDFRMRELDETYGDMYAAICGEPYIVLSLAFTQEIDSDKEIEIIHELSQEVLKSEDLLSSVSDICGELDRYGLSFRDPVCTHFRFKRPCPSARGQNVPINKTSHDKTEYYQHTGGSVS